MLNKIKIGPKLIGGFLCVAGISAFVGYVGIDKMNTMSKADTYLYEKATVPLGDLVEIALTFEIAIRDLRDLGRVNSEQTRESLIATIESTRSRLGKACERYESTIVDDEGKKIYAEFLAVRKNIAVDITSLYSLSRANKTADVYNLIDNSLAKHSMEEEKLIERMIKHNIGAAKKISENNTATANSAAKLLIGVIIF
jgi:methyl-accepting chemotaxis protein